MKTTKFSLKAYSMAMLTLAAGIGVSIHFQDWSWFSRSGSLIVVNGIILTSHQIIEHIHNLNRYQRERQVNHDWAAADKFFILHEDHENRWMSEKHGLYMLVAGTLIWGFGDLLNYL